ncbi:MAG: hypothetical protein AB1726_01530 [Planctomycetota bacterium]
MPASARRARWTIGGVVALAAGLLLALSLPWGGEGGTGAETVEATAGPVSPAGRGPAAIEGPPEAPAARPAGREAGSPLPLPRIACLRAADLAPVAGVRLYDGIRRIAGPAGEDGILEVPDPHGPDLVVWGRGWRPARIGGPPLPDRVLLAAVDGTLEVRIANRTALHRIVRAEIQTHLLLGPAGGPWEARLSRQTDDLYVASPIAPGEYDVYLWVRRDGGEPLPISRRAVAIAAGTPTVVTVDVAEAAAIEPDG